MHGIVNLSDPIEKHLLTSVKMPQFKGQKIILEDFDTHASGLPEFPPNYGGLPSKDRMQGPNFKANS